MTKAFTFRFHRFLLVGAVFFVFCFCWRISYSQTQGEWVWLHGSNTSNSAGNFGTIGVPSPNNDPPAVYEPCEWTDKNGNFWLYGGHPNSGTNYATLWKYNVSANEWTWMKGPSTIGYTGSYGTIGVPSPGNNPPSKSHGATSWTDASGNLWLFGGLNSSYGFTNDLWKYDISSNEWTWMGGTNTSGVYGVRGVPDTSNHPASRSECAAGWKDNSNNLWVFGGIDNDLWRYNITINEWSWMKGDTIAGMAVHGTLGVEDSLNTPGMRCTYSHWKDVNGNLWLFGGMLNTTTPYNDLWRFNLVTNNWTWMGGDTLGGASSVYGTRCTANSTNVPGERFENRAVWTDQSGNFWMFGGGAVGNFQFIWNDLWMYYFAIKQWIWISGDSASNPAGNWGTQGVWSTTNKPNGRGGAVSWTDHNGNLYLFGGSTSPWPNMYNDLWEFAIDTSCGSRFQSGLPVGNFTSSDTIFCNEPTKCVSFFDHSANNPTTWQWLFPGATPNFSNQQNPTNICYYNAGTYPVILIVTNAAGSDTLTVAPMITVGSAPAPPVITVIGGDTLYSSHGAHYQWYFNGTLIPNATDSFYISHQSGLYSVQITDGIGCNSVSSGATVGVEELQGLSFQLVVYPNPANSLITVSLRGTKQSPDLEIYNVLGVKMTASPPAPLQRRGESVAVDVSSFSKGVYVVQLTVGEKVYRAKFIKD